ncbi:MAG: tetratricopeptide repeat protein, partial [Betaproteobacteria bacterium]
MLYATGTTMMRIPRATGRNTQRLTCAVLFTCFAWAASAQDSQEINRLIRAGQYAAAAEKADALLAKNPKDPQARFLKGVILSEQGKSNEAIGMFQALTEDYPELPEPYNNLASLFASKGQYEKAKTALEMAIQTNPSYGTAYENLGDVYAKLASQSYDKALQLDKSNTTAQAKLAAIRGAFASGAKAPSAQGAPAAPVTPAIPQKAEPARPAPTTTAPKADAAKPASSVVPASVSVSAAVPAGAASSPASADTAAIMQAVNAWVGAWSSRNLDGYFGAYSTTFAPDGKSREEWEAARRVSFPGINAVRVSIEQPEVSMLGDSEAQV